MAYHADKQSPFNFSLGHKCFTGGQGGSKPAVWGLVLLCGVVAILGLSYPGHCQKQKSEKKAAAESHGLDQPYVSLVRPILERRRDFHNNVNRSLELLRDHEAGKYHLLIRIEG